MFEFLLGDSGLTLQQFQSQFKEFIIDNHLVGTAAGVTIGITTKDLIQSFVGDIIIPFFYLIAFQLGIEKLELLAGKNTFDYTSFIRQVITWILSVITTFFFVYYFFMSLVGINEQNIQTGVVSQPISPVNSSIQPTTPINQNNSKLSSYNYGNPYNSVNSAVSFQEERNVI